MGKTDLYTHHKLLLEQMQLKFQQSVELKLEAFKTRMDMVDSTQSTIDKKVEALVKTIGSMEHGDTSGHVRGRTSDFSEAVLLGSAMTNSRAHCNLQLKHDLLHITVVGEQPTQPTPPISSPPWRSSTFSVPPTRYPIVHIYIIYTTTSTVPIPVSYCCCFHSW